MKTKHRTKRTIRPHKGRRFLACCEKAGLKVAIETVCRRLSFRDEVRVVEAVVFRDSRSGWWLASYHSGEKTIDVFLSPNQPCPGLRAALREASRQAKVLKENVSPKL